MKKGKKIFCLVLALSMFALMAMGSGSSSSAETKSDEGSSRSVLSNESAADKKAGLPTIEEQVLVEQDGIKVTAKELVKDSFLGYGLKLLIENNSSKNLGVGCDALIVNDYMVNELFSASVAAGKKSNETMYILSSELEKAGINNIGQIETYFHIYDEDTYMTVSNAPCALIRTSSADETDTVLNDDGSELYSENGIRIVGKHLGDNSVFGKQILLFIKNDSGRNVGISCDNMSVNGFMVTPFFSRTVYNGKMAIGDITLLSSELEENGITEIEEVELSFHIYDADSFATIADSPPVAFSIK